MEALTGGRWLDVSSLSSFEPEPQNVVEAQELQRRVLESVDGLSPKNKAATLLFYYEQLSVREVAATLGISVSAAKVRLHRSRSELRDALADLLGISDECDGEGGRHMVEVKIADVAGGKRNGAELFVILLSDEVGGRLLPIWVRPPEGEAIATAARRYEYPRPMTHNLMHDLLGAMGATLEEVRIEELKDDMFLAVVKLSVGDKVSEIDARPSDAMALASLAGAPIYAATDVIERAGLKLSEEQIERIKSGAGLDVLIEMIELGTKAEPEEREERIKELREEWFSVSEGILDLRGRRKASEPANE